MLLEIKQYFAETLQVIVQEVPSFETVTPFLRGVINLRFCLFEDVTDYRDLRKINIRSFVSIGFFFFFYIITYQSAIGSLIITIQR